MPLLLLLLLQVLTAVWGQDDDLPPRQNVLQVFLFTSSSPLDLVFQDTFCPGLATLIWDNDQFLGTTPSLQNFCGISVRGDASVIVNPIFTKGTYRLAAGSHNLTVLVYGSPTPNGKATQSLTLFPLDDDAEIIVQASKTIPMPAQQARTIVQSVPKALDNEHPQKRSLLPQWVLEHSNYRPKDTKPAYTFSAPHVRHGHEKSAPLPMKGLIRLL